MQTKMKWWIVEKKEWIQSIYLNDAKMWNDLTKIDCKMFYSLTKVD